MPDTKVQSLSRGVTANVIGALVSPLTGIIDANVAADMYSFQLNSFYRNPQIHPSPEVLFDMYNRKFIDYELMKTLARNQGINLNGITVSARHRNLDRAWTVYQEYSKERPSVAFIMSLWGRGYWAEQSQEARNAIDRAGGSSSTWQSYVTAMYEFPPMDTLMQGKLRGVINDDQFTEGMKRHGYGFAHHRNLYRELLKVNPGPADWVHFAVKEALSPDVANGVGLYNEFPEAIGRYLGWHGLNWEIGMPIVANGVNRQATVADLYWASHWQPIAPSQAFGMFHLLRANRLQRYRDAGLDVTAFTMADVDRWLRINDYPNTVRQNLAALSFTPLRLVDIRQALTMNYRFSVDANFRSLFPQAVQQRIDQYGRAWAIEQFRDRGVLPEDANTQVDLALAAAVWTYTAEERSAARSQRKELVKVLLSGYSLGIIDAENLRRRLTNIGLPNGTITAMIEVADAKETLHNSKVAIDAATRGYRKGSINRERYRELLTRSGLTDHSIRNYIENADYNRDYDRIHATTAKIVAWTGQGFLSYQDAKDRLENLGWSEPDTILLLAEANSRNVKLQGQAIRAADATRQKRARELEKALKQAQKNVELIQAAIRRQTPITTLQRMVRKRIITQQQFTDRAIRSGYPADVAAAYLRDALTVEKKPSSPSAGTPSKPEQGQQASAPTEQPPPAQAPTNEPQAPQAPPQAGQQVQRPDTTLVRHNTALPGTDRQV